jgi:hypothetical protein
VHGCAKAFAEGLAPSEPTGEREQLGLRAIIGVEFERRSGAGQFRRT